MGKNRKINYLLILLILNVLVTLVCFGMLSGESLPYQDPTIEMLKAQAQAIQKWKTILNISLITMGALAGVLLYQKHKKRNAV
jgi:hypothetical protein